MDLIFIDDIDPLAREQILLGLARWKCIGLGMFLSELKLIQSRHSDEPFVGNHFLLPSFLVFNSLDSKNWFQFWRELVVIDGVEVQNCTSHIITAYNRMFDLLDH